MALFDAMGPSEEFKATHARVQSSIRFIHGDLHDAESVRAAGTSDVVWCTGVLYHTPHPLLLLHHLRQMTGQHLILGSRVIPEVPGLEQASVFYPGTGPVQRSVFADVHGAEAVAMAGAAAPFDETPDREYANYWWGITPSALLAMLRYAGFDVIEQYRYFPFSLDVVAAASTRPSLVPALNFKPLPYGLT